jgi:glycosyltransferase involved in cell wall biosynthesis
MHILVVSKFYPPVIGGVETTVLELCENYVRKGHDCRVVVMDPERGGMEKLNGVEVHRFPVDTKVLAGLNRHIFRYLARELRSSRYDIVQIHNFHILLSFQTALFCRLRGVPYIFSAHYHGKGHTPIRNLLFNAYKTVGRLGLSGSARVTTGSKFERSKLLHDFRTLASKCVVISPGIRERHMPDLERRKDTLLYVGRLMRYKGVDHVLDAIRSLKVAGNLVSLRVVGTGPEEAILKQRASDLGLTEQITWLGDVSDQDLTKEYATASCLILLSAAEAYGLVVAEALSCGAPCIVADMEALSEFLQEPGCFRVAYPPEPEKVAGTILRVLRSPSIKIGPFSDKITTWPRAADKYLELFDLVVRESGSSKKGPKSDSQSETPAP